jgi:hypothetical protein
MSRDGDQEREAIASWSDGTAGLLGVAVWCIVHSPNVTKSAQEPNGIKLGKAKGGGYSKFRYLQLNNFAISTLFRA